MRLKISRLGFNRSISSRGQYARIPTASSTEGSGRKKNRASYRKGVALEPLEAANSDETPPLIPRDPNRKWSDVTLTMQGGDCLLIVLPGGYRKSSTFDALGFGDGRATHARPNGQWTMLKALALVNGSVKRADLSPTKKDRDNVKARISALRKDLKALFGIDDDPIIGGAREYKTKFQISMTEEFRSHIASKDMRDEDTHDGEHGEDDDEDWEAEMQDPYK